MYGTVQRTCCVFRIISPIVKQIQTSGKKQWSTLGFSSFAVVLKFVTKAEVATFDLFQYWRYTVFFSGLKSVWKLELSFLALRCFYFIFIACVLLVIGRDKIGPVDCDRIVSCTPLGRVRGRVKAASGGWSYGRNLCRDVM